MSDSLDAVVSIGQFPLAEEAFRDACRASLDAEGVLVLPDFLTSAALETILAESADRRELAYFCAQKHNVYLTPLDPEFPADHTRNREVDSSKGCITDDQVPGNSPLHALYDASLFREFLCSVLREQALYDYADPLSSINVH